MAIQSVGNYGSGTPQPATAAATPRPAATTAPGIAEQAMPHTEQPSKEQLQKAVQEISKSMGSNASNLQFSIDSDTNQTIVRVVDRQTGDVIRQIPSEEVVAMTKALDQMKGLLLRQKA